MGESVPPAIATTTRDHVAELAVQAEHVGKRFFLTGGGAGYDRLSEALMGLVRRPLAPRSRDRGGRPFWALKDVSFAIEAGSAVGIIGRNGAGKSTLLKVLSRITMPTEGRVIVRGRIASLLEVGTGFHPELSGRENVYLAGAVLGMRRGEIQRKFDEIVDFSGVGGEFLDTPVKRYSSGMQVRLGFAVAAHLESEILLIDEVLAVGDIEFQKRCLGKMGEAARTGRTVLFISHQLPLIASLCDNALLMDHGHIVASGPTPEVIREYQGGAGGNAASVDHTHDEARPGDGVISLLAAWVENGAGAVAFDHEIGDPIRICIQYRVHEDLVLAPQPSIHVTDASGGVAFVTGPSDGPSQAGCPAGDYAACVEIPGHFLNDGMFGATIAVNHYKRGIAGAFYESGALTFNVIDKFETNPYRLTSRWVGRIPGVVRPRLAWKTRQVEPVR